MGREPAPIGSQDLSDHSPATLFRRHVLSEAAEAPPFSHRLFSGHLPRSPGVGLRCATVAEYLRKSRDPAITRLGTWINAMQSESR